MLKVIEREGVKSDRNLDSRIGVLIGKGLHEFTALRNSEVNDFRWKMRVLGDEVAMARQKKSWMEKVRYQFPTRLAPTATIPKNIECRLKDGNIVLVTKFENTEVREQLFYYFFYYHIIYIEKLTNISLHSTHTISYSKCLLIIGFS